MKEKNAKDILNLSSDAILTSGGLVLSEMAAGSIGLALGVAATSYLALLFKNLGNELIKRRFGDRELFRVQSSTLYTVSLIKSKLDAGQQPRNDDSFKSHAYYRSKAEELLEGVVLSCQRTYEEKKLEHLSAFYANLVFSSDMDAEKANFYLSIFNSLSYRQVCLVYTLRNNLQIESEKSENINDESDFFVRPDAIADVHMLQQNGLVRTVWRIGNLNDYSSRILASDVTITSLGLELIECFSLSEINSTDIALVNTQLRTKNN
jgi:hypothetical protein